MEEDYDGRVFARGRWLYDNQIWEAVEVVGFDCDFHFERLPMDDGRKAWTPYPLNGDGLLFYLSFRGDLLPITPFRSVDAAKAWADAQPWAPICWE